MVQNIAGYTNMHNQY